jgi:hypothetical protein
MKRIATVLIALAIGGTALTPARADDGADEKLIHATLNAMFDKPEARLTVDPVVVEQRFAVAGWTQADMGGRGLLRKEASGWTLILCSGDGLKSAGLLEDAGVPDDVARRLAAKLAAAEAKLDPARVAQFSRFDGVVYMGKDHPGGHAGH